MKVAICINTYLRPSLLVQLLESIAAMEVPGEAELFLVVVDNDARGSARSIVENVRLPWPVTYDVEAERNISLARNRALQHARSKGADFVAFIDDDEVASAQWLCELLRVQHQTGAEVVTGPVLGRLGAEAPRWARHGPFFTRQRRAESGTPVSTAETANALVARSVIETVEFDPSFGLAGSGDSRFFLCASMNGARLVWAPRAVVEENVQPSRTTVQWLLRRAFREGNGGAFVERGVVPWRVWLLRRISRAVVRLFLAGTMLVVAPFRGPIAVIAALRLLAFAIGSIAGVFGYRYVEYGGDRGE